MKYFDMDRLKIREIVYKLHDLCEKMDKLEDEIVNSDIEVPKNLEVRKKFIENDFQEEASKIIVLSLLSDDILYGLFESVQDKIWDYNETERQKWFDNNCKVAVKKYED